MINNVERARKRVLNKFDEDILKKIEPCLDACVESIHPVYDSEALDGDETLLIAELFLAKLDEVNGNE